jgi:transglutaminase-like putative cysteine protease
MWIVVSVAFIVWYLTRSSSVGGNETVTLPQLPGAASIVQTIGFMKVMINQSIAHPLIRRQAARATEGCGRYDRACQAKAITEWTRSRMRYVADPDRHEHVTNPVTLAKAIEEGKHVYGDCDDMTVYSLALGKSIGLPAVIHAVGRRDQFHHVYGDLAGYPVDATVGFDTSPFRAKSQMSLSV